MINNRLFTFLAGNVIERWWKLAIIRANTSQIRADRFTVERVVAWNTFESDVRVVIYQVVRSQIIFVIVLKHSASFSRNRAVCEFFPIVFFRKM